VYPFLNRKLKRVIPRLEEIVKEDSKYYWKIQEYHSKHPLRYKKRFATIYLVSLVEIKECVYKRWEDRELLMEDSFSEDFGEIDGVSYNQFELYNVTIDMLIQTYPTLLFRLDRGDIIEFIEESGYRSQGILFFDGEKLITQCTDYDDYGTPPIEFEVITEFPPDYFKKPYRPKNPNGHPLTVISDYVWNERPHISEFYWHSDECYMPLNILKLGLTKKIEDVLSNKLDRDRFVYFTYKNLKVLLIIDYDMRRLEPGTEHLLVHPIYRENHRFSDDINIVLTTDW
jgi:hypothetical protein